MPLLKNHNTWQWYLRCQATRMHSEDYKFRYVSALPSIMMPSSNGNISALPALCEGNPSVTRGFPSQRPVTRSFDVFFDLHLNKHSRRRWFETPSRLLWRHCYVRVNLWPDNVIQNGWDFVKSRGTLSVNIDLGGIWYISVPPRFHNA